MAEIASIAQVFDPAKARNAEELAFRERVQRVARGEAGTIELRETLTELAVADIMGRRRDGTAMPAGSITVALDAALEQAASPAQVREIGKVRAFIRAVRTHFRAMFGTMSALDKARREGGAQEFDALVSKLFGEDWQAAKEWTAERGTMNEEALAGEETAPAMEAAYSLKQRTDKRASWAEVKPGHSWSSAKKHLPKLNDARAGFFKRGSWNELVDRIATWLPQMGTVKDPWGSAVRFDNPQSKGDYADPLKNRAAHLIGKDISGKENRKLRPEKLDWIGATKQTIEDAQIRVLHGNETIYFPPTDSRKSRSTKRISTLRPVATIRSINAAAASAFPRFVSYTIRGPGTRASERLFPLPGPPAVRMINRSAAVIGCAKIASSASFRAFAAMGCRRR